MDRNILWDRIIKLAGLLFGCAIIASAISYGSASTTNNKMDSYLSGQINNPGPDTYIPVVIIFKEQPAHGISLEVKREFKDQFEEITKPAKAIYTRIKPGMIGGTNKNVSELFDLESSLLTEQEKDILKDTGEKLDSKTREMRREILSKTAPIVNEIQAPVINKITARGGSITFSSKILNAIAADIPVSYISELSEEQSIYKIYYDNVLNASLDISGQAMGADTWWNSGYNGSFMDAAVIDTGIDNSHPALDVDYEDVFHTSGRFHSLYNDEWNNPDDLQGHGTHVAGIVASTDPTFKGAGNGIDKLINAKAGWRATDGRGYMYLSDAMKAIDWAIFGNADDADVISYSFGGGSTNGDSGFEHFMDSIVYNLDIPVVIAAGNAGSGAGSVGEPAGAFNVIAVGNIYDSNTPPRTDDNLAFTSSRGPTLDGRIKPDISAPGSGIMSANNNWETGGDFVSLSGTSMATPNVAGSILLILDYKNMRWKPEAIKALLLNTAEDKGTSGPDNDYGFGYVDLSSAYVHRDDVIADSIDDQPDGNVEKYYKGILNNNDRATLVWNRHIIYNGKEPNSYLNTSNLDLYVYNETNGNTISFSISDKNNIEQVKSNSFHSSAILKINPHDTFPPGITLEDYALATDNVFINVSPPILYINVSNPENVESGANFTLNVTINNGGGISAHNVSVSITLPSGFTIISGANPQTIGSINAGNSKIATWVVEATNVNPASQFILEANFTSNSYDELYMGDANNTMMIDPWGYINGTVLSNGTAVAGSIISTNTSIMKMTDTSGTYSLFVPAGTYVLMVTDEPVYYPNNSVIVNVTEGMTVVRNIELDNKPVGIITGRITNKIS